jgi:hypothetical protein
MAKMNCAVIMRSLLGFAPWWSAIIREACRSLQQLNKDRESLIKHAETTPT